VNPVVVSFFGVFALLVVAGLAYSGSRTRSSWRQIQTLAPDKFAFAFSALAGFEDAAPEIITESFDRPISGRGVVAADSAGITIWIGHPAKKIAVLPWASIEWIRATSTTVGRVGIPTVAISVDDDGSGPVTVPFVGANAGQLPNTSAAGARRIVEELEQLRQARSSPRLI
jgi:hypothetical protein